MEGSGKLLAAGLILLGWWTVRLPVEEKERLGAKDRWVRRGLRGSLLAGAFLTGLFRMGQALEDWEETRAALPEDKACVRLSGQVADIREKGRYDRIVIRTKDAGQVLVYVEKEPVEQELIEQEPAHMAEDRGRWQGTLRIGEKIFVEGKASRFEGARNPGQFDLEGYYRSRGISMALFADRLERMEAGEGAHSPYLDGLYRFRRRCSQVLVTICEEMDSQIFRAALLGEREEMDEALKDLYQRNGISHLLAISGLHLSMLGMGFYKLLRKAGAGYGAAALAGGGLVISYGLMTGASGSALRAALMLAAAFLAAFLGRTYDLLSALSLAALLLAFSKPFLIGDSGFQLSFGAVLGIGLLGERLIKAAGARRAWQKDILISLAVQLMTAPVVLWHYFQYPTYGIVLNLLVVPLMGYVLLSGLLGICAGLVAPALGVAAVGSGHYILQWYQKLCLSFSALPGSRILSGRPGWGQIACYYLLLAGMLLVLQRGGAGDGKAERAGERKKALPPCSFGMWKLLVLSVGSLCGFLCLRPSMPDGCHITFLDVGQGDGIVILCEGSGVWMSGLEMAESGADGAAKDPFSEKAGRFKRTAILVDGGSTSEKRLGEERLEPFLKAKGIGCIDLALVSHGDEDHISGLLYLLEECAEIQIRRLVLPEKGRKDAGYDRLLAAARARGTWIGYMDTGDWIQAGSVRLRCLYPGKEEEIDPTDRNQQSLILRVEHESFHMLLTGDADQQGERRMVEQQDRSLLSDIQVLKAAHHGSRHSNSQVLLEAVRPALTVLSYKEGNLYGHPHKEALERIEAVGSRVLRTGEQGAVMLHSKDGRLEYSTYLR